MAKIFQWLVKVKLLKTKHKEKNLKLARGKKVGGPEYELVEALRKK